MILGIGVDRIELGRIEKSIEKHGDTFLKKVFTKGEIAYAKDHADSIGRFALRFAAKEAFFKALKTGFTKGVSWQDVDVVRNDDGAPDLYVSGTSLKHLEALTPKGFTPHVHVSLTDDETHALAFVIISAVKV